MRGSTERVVYMDYAATTPVDPRVAEAMAECLTLDGTFANPSSTGHLPGITARRRVEEAREQVAQLIGAQAAEIVWTSGATESNNLAILGAARFHRDRGNHVVTAKTEHKAALDFLAHPSCLGVVDPGLKAVDLLCDLVDSAQGAAELVDLDQIAADITDKTAG